MKNLFKPFEFLSSNNFKLLAVIQAIIFLILWSIIPSQTIPTPIEILSAWHELASAQGMLVELFNSSITVLKAIALSSMITLLMAMLATAAIFKPVVTWGTAFRFLGFAGITFLFTMWTGGGSQLKLWLLTFGMTAFLLTNVMAVIESITQDEIDYARTLRLDGWKITYEVAFRGKLDEFLDLIRQNAAIGWTMLSMVEGLVRSEGGIGSLLLNQSKHLHLSSIFAIQLTILVYGISQDWFLKYLRELACPYVKLSTVRK